VILAENTEKRWIVRSLNDVAAFFRSPRQSIQNWRRDGMPGAKGEWSLPDITAWRMEKLRRGEAAWTTGDSPALEEYRRERAKLARLERLERERQLVRREVIHQHLTRFASIIRQLGEQLQKAYGADAGEMLMDAMDDAERELAAISDCNDDGIPASGTGDDP
jgi:hypothetical protein